MAPHTSHTLVAARRSRSAPRSRARAGAPPWPHASTALVALRWSGVLLGLVNSFRDFVQGLERSAPGAGAGGSLADAGPAGAVLLLRASRARCARALEDAAQV